MGSSQDFDFLQNIWRDFFITIVFPEVEEFELCRGEKTIGDGLHLKDGGIEQRTGRGEETDGMEDGGIKKRLVTLFCHNWKQLTRATEAIPAATGGQETITAK